MNLEKKSLLEENKDIRLRTYTLGTFKCFYFPQKVIFFRDSFFFTEHTTVKLKNLIILAYRKYNYGNREKLYLVNKASGSIYKARHGFYRKF